MVSNAAAPRHEDWVRSEVEDYRVFFIGAEGNFEGSRTFECDTDETAIAWVLMEDRPLELSRRTTGETSARVPTKMIFYPSRQLGSPRNQTSGEAFKGIIAPILAPIDD
jgi:hypothetical protein